MTPDTRTRCYCLISPLSTLASVPTSRTQHARLDNASPTQLNARKTIIGGSFPATYSLLPLAMSTSGEVGPDVHALIKELAIRRAKNSSEVHSEEPRRLAEGTEIAHLRLRFSFVLQQALSFRTRHHICSHGVALTYSHRVRSQDTTSRMKICTDRNRAQGREGGDAKGTGERRAGGTEPVIDRFETVYLRDSGTTTINQPSQSRVSTPARATCNSRRKRCSVEKEDGTGRGVGVG